MAAVALLAPAKVLVAAAGVRAEPVGRFAGAHRPASAAHVSADRARRAHVLLLHRALYLHLSARKAAVTACAAALSIPGTAHRQRQAEVCGQRARLLAIEDVLHHQALFHRHLVLERDKAKAARPAVRLPQHLPRRASFSTSTL